MKPTAVNEGKRNPVHRQALATRFDRRLGECLRKYATAPSREESEAVRRGRELHDAVFLEPQHLIELRAMDIEKGERTR